MKEDNRSEQQAIAQLESIRELVAALNATDRTGKEGSHEWMRQRDEAEQAIHEDPLCVEVRSGWYGVQGGSSSGQKPAEYNILLATGGPACRIIGALDEDGEPESAHIEHQDWGTPWTEYRMTREDEDVVLAYVRCFYFGDA